MTQDLELSKMSKKKDSVSSASSLGIWESDQFCSDFEKYISSDSNGSIQSAPSKIMVEFPISNVNEEDKMFAYEAPDGSKNQTFSQRFIRRVTPSRRSPKSGSSKCSSKSGSPKKTDSAKSGDLGDAKVCQINQQDLERAAKEGADVDFRFEQATQPDTKKHHVRRWKNEKHAKTDQLPDEQSKRWWSRNKSKTTPSNLSAESKTGEDKSQSDSFAASLPPVSSTQTLASYKSSTPRSESSTPMPASPTGAPGARLNPKTLQKTANDASMETLYLPSQAASSASIIQPDPSFALPPHSISNQSQSMPRPIVNFDSFQEFMKSDLDQKHRHPVCDREFLFVDTLMNEKEGWHNNIKRDHLQVDTRDVQLTDRTAKMVRAFATFPGIKKEILFYLSGNIEVRAKWDKLVKFAKILADDIEDNDVIYGQVNMPMVSAREYCNYRKIKKIELDDNENDYKIVVVQRSCEHPNVDLPPASVRKNCVWTENYIMAFEYYDLADGSGAGLNYLVMTDPGGSIPKWVQFLFYVFQIFRRQT